MSTEERMDRDEAIDQFWDQVAQGQDGVPGRLTLTDVATIRAFHTADDRPEPNAVFARQLREELMQATTIPLLSNSSPRAAANGHPGPVALVPWIAPRSASPGRAGLTALATAALVVTLVAAYLALGPARPGGTPIGQSDNLPALLAPATPVLKATTEEVLLETTLFGLAYDLPSTPALIHLDRIQLPPGASVSLPPDALDLGAYSVESGTLTINMIDDVPVTRHGQLRGLVYGGEDTQLKPGDGFVRKPTIGGEIRNDGTEPVVYAVIRIVPETPEEPASDPGL